MTSNSDTQLPPALTDFKAIQAQENEFIFDIFTSETAFEIGCLLRKRIPELAGTASNPAPPAAVNISLATGVSGNLLFHGVTSPGVGGSGKSIAPDNDIWIERKRATVLRWGTSTYALHYKFNGLATQEDRESFGIRFGKENISKYCFFGGGFPVRVRNVEGVVAVIVVSGLPRYQDHGCIVQVLKEWFALQKEKKQ